MRNAEAALRCAGRGMLAVSRARACAAGPGARRAMGCASRAGAAGRGRSDHAPATGCRGRRGRGVGGTCASGCVPGGSLRCVRSCHEVPRATRGARIRIIAITCLPWPAFAPHMRGYTPVCADSYEAMTTMSSVAKKICLVLVLLQKTGSGSRRGRFSGMKTDFYQRLALVSGTARDRAQMRMWCTYAATHKIGLVATIGAS